MTFAVILTLFLCSWLGAFPATPIAAAAQEEWVRSLSFATGSPAAMAVDPQGNVYLTGLVYGQGSGYAYNFATIKYSPGGEELWVKYFGGVSSNNGPEALALDGQGNVLVTGNARELQHPFMPSYTTIKYSPDGEQLWLQQYPEGRGNVKALAVDQQGNVYVIGNSPSRSNYITIKYSADGAHLWTRTYQGPQSKELVQAITVDGQGNVLVTGDSWNGASYDFATIKYSPEGTALWKRRYHSPVIGANHARAIAVDSQGNAYVTGQSAGGRTGSDIALIKYGQDGTQLWVRRYKGGTVEEKPDIPTAIAVDGQDNVLVTGSSCGRGNLSDYVTLKYSPEGQCLWAQRYNGPRRRHDSPAALALDGQGNVYVTGTSWGSGTYYDYATIKYSPDGEQLWECRYVSSGHNPGHPPGYNGDYASALAVDALGNVYVTGRSYNGAGYDFVTIKYNQQ